MFAQRKHTVVAGKESKSKEELAMEAQSLLGGVKPGPKKKKRGKDGGDDNVDNN